MSSTVLIYIRLLFSLTHRPQSDCRPNELIYVYDLPSEFHVDVLGPSCAASNFWAIHPRNACVVYSPEDGGSGSRLTGTEVAYLDGIGSPDESWADTGQFALEIMFHRVRPIPVTSGGLSDQTEGNAGGNRIAGESGEGSLQLHF
jgi:hypothetical protein